MKNIQKTTVVILLIFCTTICLQAQVGINTENVNESAMLHIESANKGVLFPQFELRGVSDPYPFNANDIPERTIVFNAKDANTGSEEISKGYYVWKDGKWKSPLLKDQKNVARFYANTSNSSFVFNGNVGSKVNVEAFNTAEFNTDPTLFELVSSTSLKINKSGTYIITTNLGLIGALRDASQAEVYMAYALNGTIVSSQVMIRPAQQRDAQISDGSMFTYSIIDYVTVTTAGSIVSLVATTKYNDDTIKYDSSKVSSITIVEL